MTIRCILQRLAITACLPLAACLGSGSDSTSSDAASTNVTAGGVDTTAQALSSAAAAFVAIDTASIANYAAPSLPPYYDATVADDDNTPAGDPATDRIATLGRVLFHDKRLSQNNTVACASCHEQARGFGTTPRFSTGFAGGLTTAHAMRIGNVRYFGPGSMFWDRRAATLEAQATQPIQNAVEMGFDAANGGIDALLGKMRGLPYYPELFTFAYGDATIDESRVQRALAQFQRAMVSVNSRWDAGYAANYDPALPDRGTARPIAGFSAAENRGLVLFMTPRNRGGGGCSACHQPPSFGLVANSRSNGLDAGETRVFKSPSLKNVALSGAFMHDGRFTTLEQVVEHYNSGVQNGPALDNRLRAGNGQPLVLNLSDADKAALAAFMRTLTDPVLTTDAKFGSPFRQ